MIRTVRAAGFAVAACVLAVSAAWSGPLQAGEGNVAPVATHYLDHAAAAVEASDIGVNDETATAEATPMDSEDLAHLGALADQMVTLADAILTPQVGLGALVQSYAGISTDGREQDCLANAVYFEARGEPVEGQLAVAEVVLNRTRSGRYPSTICEVVTQPWQFSFVRNGIIPAADRSSESWRKAVAIARIAEAGAQRLLPRDVLWYHADYVNPSWGRRLARNTKIGLHIFYS
jgi:spore germination cell wall hydrolase CwlJ-like protein